MSSFKFTPALSCDSHVIIICRVPIKVGVGIGVGVHSIKVGVGVGVGVGAWVETGS